VEEDCHIFDIQEQRSPDDKQEKHNHSHLVFQD
jgi:hypothetical protein